MTEPSLTEILQFTFALSREASRLILPLLKNVAVDHKPDGSEVTAADQKAEQLLRRWISGCFPDHAIPREEFGGHRTRDAKHLWLHDPIDGTAPFAIGLPLFATLIGYLCDGDPCVGVIGAHALGETIYAAAGQGCWDKGDGCKPQRVRTSATTDLVATSLEQTGLDPSDPSPQSATGNCTSAPGVFVGRVASTTPYWPRADAAVEPRMNPGTSALAPCVREAGGALSPLEVGEHIVWQRSLVASANPALHARVLQSLRLESSQGLGFGE